MRSIYLIIASFISILSIAQTNGKINDRTKNMQRHDGYFTYWWDAANGKIWLQADKLGTEFLYVNSLPSGIGSNDLGLDRGQIGDTRIVFFNKVAIVVLFTIGIITVHITVKNTKPTLL